MVQMALPLLMGLLLLAAPVQAKKNTEQNTERHTETHTEKHTESCEPQLKQLKQLEAQLEALRKENGELKLSQENAQKLSQENAKKLSQANIELQKQVAKGGEVPFLSTKVIVDSLGHVTDLALSKGSLNKVDLAPVYTAANAAYAHATVASEHATAAASKGYAAATEALLTSTKLAQDLHGKHVSQHSREYYDVTVETYTVHLEPHVSVARKAYYDNVHPHVSKASETIYASVGAAVDHGKALSPKVTDLVKLGMQSFSQASSGPVGEQLAFLVQPQTFQVMGRTFTFEHGFVDMGLAAVQGLIAFYLAFNILWKLCLSTLVWKIGIKFLGRKVFLGVTAGLVKVCFRVTRLILKICFTLVLTILAFALSWLMMAICSGLGVALLHAIEKGASVGLKPGMRLAVGAGVGMLFYLLCRCKFCKRRQEVKKGAAAKKTDPKKVSKSADAKQAAAKPANKNSKK